MKRTADRALHVGVYGTGKVGKLAVEQLIAAGHRIVAGIVHDEGKRGQDLGVLTGRESLGVPATTQLKAAVADPELDVLVYTGIHGDSMLEAIDTAVSHGKDFVTATFADPAVALGSRAESMRRRAVESGSRVFGTGMTPGTFTDAVPALLATALPDPVTVRVIRQSDISFWSSTSLNHDIGVGQKPGRVRSNKYQEHLEEAATILAAALGRDVENVEWRPRLITADAPTEIAGIAADVGDVVGFDHAVVGSSRGREIFEVVWKGDANCLERGISPGVEIGISSDSGLELHARIAVPADGFPGTVSRMVKAIPVLRSMPPGLYNPAGLPTIPLPKFQ